MTAKPEQTWAQIARAAVERAAVEVITDVTRSAEVRTDAKRALVERADVRVLTLPELVTWSAITSKLLRRTSEAELLVVGERRVPCIECQRRAGRHYVDLTPFDHKTRLAVLEAIENAPPELREEFNRDDDPQDDSDQDHEGDGAIETLGGPELDRASAEDADAATAEATRAGGRVDQRPMEALGPGPGSAT